MAFSRMMSMDSWNPFSKSFWTWDNLFGESKLSKIKNEFIQQLDAAIPDILQDPITYELPQKVVFTPYGNCYDVDTLEKHWLEQYHHDIDPTCPLTNRPLSTEWLLNDARTAKLKKWFNDIHIIRQTLLSTIQHMTAHEKDRITQQINDYQSKLNDTAELCQIEFEHIRKLDNLKEHLKINIHSPDHLSFWQKSSYKGIIKKIGLVPSEKITDYKGNEYVIPKPVADVIRLAQHPYQTETELNEAIEIYKSKMKKSHNFSNFFYKLSASQTESQLFSTKTISEIDLRGIKY